MELKNIFNKGFWIGLCIGVISFIFIFNLKFFEGRGMLSLNLILPIIGGSLIIGLVLFGTGLLNWSSSEAFLTMAIIGLIIPIFYGMITNLISNKIQRNYLKWSFIIFSIILFIIINYISGSTYIVLLSLK